MAVACLDTHILIWGIHWHAKKDSEAIASLRSGGATRPELRADTMIVATALAAGATVIYGHDQRVGWLADSFIQFQDIAELVVQTTLPEDEPSS